MVTGSRRLGKTSLILVALNELGLPFIYFDARGLPLNPSMRDVYEGFADAINRMLERRRGLVESIRRYLEVVSGVQFMGFTISLSWSGRQRTSLTSLFASINEWARDHGERVVLVLDEVQRISGRWTRMLADLVAYIYDHCEAVTVIVSGSEAGVLYRFLGVDNPEHPLYGRHLTEIRLSRFTRSQSIDFLVEGFKQVGIEPPQDFIKYAVEKLDGVVGWLVELGLRAIEERRFDRNLVDQVLETASMLALAELEHLLATRPAEARERYMLALIAIAQGYNTWTKIAKFIAEKTGRTVSKSVLSNILRNLLDMDLIEKIVEGRNIYYRVRDPVLEHGLRKLEPSPAWRSRYPPEF